VTTYYTRRRSAAGRNHYTPVAENYPDALHSGAWLVVVDAGCRTTRRLLNPAHAEVLAAAHRARGAMQRAMQRTNSLHVRADVTPLQLDAWAAYVEVMEAGGEPPHPLSFEGVSMVDIIDAGIGALVKEVAK